MDGITEALGLPHFLRNMRSNRVQQQQQGTKFSTGHAALLEHLVHQSHHGSDGRVVLHLFIVFGNLLHGFVHQAVQLGRIAFLRRDDFLQPPHTIQEAAASLGTVGGPRNGLIKGTHEHFVQAESVCTDFINDVVRVDHVAPGLGHLLPVFAQNHAMAGTLLVRFRAGHHANIVEEQVPEPAVEQVQGGMLHTAVVPVHRQPILHGFLTCNGMVIVRIRVADEIPAGACPLRHGICFTLGGTAAAGAGGVHPLRHGGQRAFAVIRRLIVFHVGQQHRQLIFRHGHHAALVAVNHGDGFAPVPLTAEHPVTELEVDLLFAQTFFRQVLDDGLLSLSHLHAVEEAGVYHDAILNVGIGFLLHIAAGHHFDYRQVELPCKLPVTGIVSRHSHDGTRAVGHQHIVAQPDGNFLAGHRIYGTDAFHLHAGLFLGKLCTLEVALLGGSFPVCQAGIIVGDLILQLVNQRMLRRQYHVGCAEQGIRASGVNPYLFALSRQAEIHLGAFAAADPVPLLHLYLINEVHRVQTVQQLLGVSGDLQHPLGLNLAHHRAAAPLAHAANHFFIGQAALAGGAPVNGHVCLVSQAMLVQLQEDPLGPLKVVGIGGVHLTGVIEGEADFLQLFPEMVNVLLGYGCRMHLILDRIVFRRQTEGIPADGEKHVVPFHAALPGNNVHGGIGAGMSYVQPLSGRIRELNQSVKLRLGIVVRGFKSVGFFPDFLPLGLNPFGVICLDLHCFSSSKKNRPASA